MLMASFFVLFLKKMSNLFWIWYYYLFANFRSPTFIKFVLLLCIENVN